jgi:hypothetical protein
MDDRVASRLAWAVFAFIAVLFLGGAAASAVLISSKDLLGSVPFALGVFTFPAVGVLIASRQPRNAIGWLMLAIGLTWGLVGASEIYVEFGLAVEPGSLPGPDVALALSTWMWVPGVGLIGTFLVLLFPDGQLPAPRWRPLAWASAISLTLCSLALIVAPGPLDEGLYPGVENPLGIEALRGLEAVVYGLILLIPVCIVGCAAGLIQRFRRSRGVERLRLKWFAAGAGTSAATYTVAMIVSIPYDWSPSAPLWVSVIQNVALFSFLLIPIAVGIAILRHRLYDIDRLINRTLVYGVVTASLGLVYAGGVFVAGGVLGSLTDQRGGRVAVAASTLAVAALFRPVRSRVQTFIDRRFYRHKYDIARTLDDFSVRLRDQLDLDTLSDELLALVGQTLRPTHVSLWIRPSPRV